MEIKGSRVMELETDTATGPGPFPDGPRLVLVKTDRFDFYVPFEEFAATGITLGTRLTATISPVKDDAV